MDRLDRTKYQVFEVIKNAYKFDDGIPEWDIDTRMREYYRALANKTVGYKTYYYTEKTMQRVKAMDYSSLKTEDFLNICQSGMEKGVVVTGAADDLLNFAYVLTPQHVLIGVYQRVAKSTDCIRLDNGQSFDYAFQSRFIGNIIINAGGITYNPNSIITIVNRSIAGDKITCSSKFQRYRLSAMQKEMHRRNQREGIDHDKKITELTDRDLEDAPITRFELKAFFYNQAKLEHALKMFLFLKTASIIEETYISEPPVCTYRRMQSGSGRGFIQVDSSWDADVTVLNPFTVRGHFRHQPKKNADGEWFRELIYIDAFMKKGYHRRAQKVIEEEKV